MANARQVTTKPRPVRTGRPHLSGEDWSEDDILDLRDGYESGVDPSEIAEMLLRREDEVAAKAAELGLGASVTKCLADTAGQLDQASRSAEARVRRSAST